MPRQEGREGSRNEAPRNTARSAEGMGILCEGCSFQAGSRRHHRKREEQPVRNTAVRILGCMLRLRRNPVCETYLTALRRPRNGGKRNRLLFNLLRFGALNPLYHQLPRPRARMGQLPVRGLCRIRTRYDHRQRKDAGTPRRPHAACNHMREVLRRNQGTGCKMA